MADNSETRVKSPLSHLLFGSGDFAVGLPPVFSVRLGGPLFLTAMAVGACVCGDWDSDTVAADKITPPWLVWEWLLVEAFVRAEGSLAAKTNIPGIQKVQRA